MNGGIEWSERAVAHLLDAGTCPVCAAGRLESGRCPRCGVDLTGRTGIDLWNASVEAARALRNREHLQRTALATRSWHAARAAGAAEAAASVGVGAPGRIPDVGASTAAGMSPPDASSVPPASPVVAPAASPGAQPPPPGATFPGGIEHAPSGTGFSGGAEQSAPASSVPQAGSGATLQSVLATAGAGLFAVAAIVFTYFNPELADRTLRSVIVGLITLVFLGGAWLLARRRLQFSAEAVGGLGLVFVGLDVHAVAQLVAPSLDVWTTSGIGTGVAGAIMLAAGVRARIRIWLWASVLALATVPAMVVLGSGEPFVVSLGWTGSAFAAIGLCAILPRFARAFAVSQDDSAGTPSVFASGASGRSPAAAGAMGLPPSASGSSGSPASGHPDAPGAAPETRPAQRRPLRAETVSLTILQILVSVFAIVAVTVLNTVSPWGEASAIRPQQIALVLALLAAGAMLATRHLIAWFWSFAGGVLFTVAAATAVGGLPPAFGQGSTWIGALIAAGAAAIVVLCAVAPLPGAARRTALSIGALLTFAVISLPSVLGTVFGGLALLRRFAEAAARSTVAPAWSDAAGGWAPSAMWPTVVALGVFATALALFAVLARRRESLGRLRRTAEVVSAIYAVAAVLTLASTEVLPQPFAIAVALAAAAATGAVLRLAPGRGAVPVRVTLIAGAHLWLLAAVMLAWTDRQTVPIAGLATIAAFAVVALTVPPRARFVHVGVGYGYALIVLATALSLAGLTDIALLCLTASAGLLGAIAATFIPAIGARDWQAVLVVATVPFTIGVVQVFFERSGWTALSTGLMFILALSLLLTRRPGLTGLVRTAAAAMLVPALAVVVVCIAPQLMTGSGSPVVLPIIAVLVAVVLPSGALIRDVLVSHGRGPRTAGAARIAIEGSSLLTGAIAVVLALVREAAGPGIACLVLVILGVGSVLTAVLAGRRYGWWTAGAAFTGALWSVWALAGVELPEAYLLPPTLAAAAIAVVLTVRGGRATALFAAGLMVAAVPLDVLLAVAEGPIAVPWRGYGLLAAAWALVGAVALLGRADGVRMRRLRPLRLPALGAAGIAAVAGTIQAVRWGTGVDPAPLGDGAPAVFLAAVALSAPAALALVAIARLVRTAADRISRTDAGSSDASAAGIRESVERPKSVPPGRAAGTWLDGERPDGAPATGAVAEAGFRTDAGSSDASAAGIRESGERPKSVPAESAAGGRLRTSRWLGAPAVLALGVGVWPAIEHDWFVIWAMWGLMLAGLAFMVFVASRPATTMPPVPFLFAVAFVTAIVAWSPRDLRVEWFSLPLGALLLLAGAIGLRTAGNAADEGARRRFGDWPHGWRGSWSLLAPGLVVAMSASIAATFTDPLTWRAIVVMVLALAALLLGASRRLAAPFIIGLVVLPIENVFVFSVQLGRGIESMPWWITLAVIGAVLLIIAVAGERREGADKSVAARMRDLR